MKSKSKIIEAMKGIEPFEPPKNDSIFSYKTISSGNYDPPAYIVGYILFSILEFKDFGGFIEKVWWHTYFRYKGIIFLVSDYKFGSWSLAVRENPIVVSNLVPEIIGKIKSAANHADKILIYILKKEIEKGNFFLNNVYYKLQSAYEFFHKEAKAALVALDEFEKEESSKSRNIERIAEKLNKEFEFKEIINYRLISLLNAFFSLLEFIMDVFCVFQQPQLSFSEFRTLSWQDRFRISINLEYEKDLNRVYEQLMNIWKNYRNPLTHGLRNESYLLVPLPSAGLVPVSYKHLSNTLHYGFFPISPESGEEIVKTFAMFLEKIKEREPYCYYILYLDYGFPVPVDENSVQKIINKMTDYEGFEQYLQERSEYEDAVRNRDI